MTYILGFCLVFVGMIIGRIIEKDTIIKTGYLDYRGDRFSVQWARKVPK